MSKTNSNSITSILIYELNNNEFFKKEMLKVFREKSKSEIPENILFYDGTHSPLKIKTMGEKEVDIYARVPGKYKIYLMIEIKAGINEDLQDSQKIGGEYWNTSNEKGIPLFFIIPKAYSHKNDKDYISENNIDWEEVLKIANNCKDKRFIEQIYHFVELTEDENYFTKQKNICKRFKNIEYCIDKSFEAKELLEKCLRKIENKHFKQTQYEFGYYWNHDTYFLGFNYIGNYYTLSFDIFEDQTNTEIGENDFYFWEGWYFIPVETQGLDRIRTITDFKDMPFHNKYLKKIDLKLLDDLKKIEIDRINDSFVLLNILNETYDSVFENNEDFELGEYLNKEYGIGYYFDEKRNKKRNFFIGLNPSLTDKSYWFSIAVQLNKVKQKEGWYLDPNKEFAYFKIKKDSLVNCKNKEELEENLKKEIQRIINLI